MLSSLDIGFLSAVEIRLRIDGDAKAAALTIVSSGLSKVVSSTGGDWQAFKHLRERGVDALVEQMRSNLIAIALKVENAKKEPV